MLDPILPSLKSLLLLASVLLSLGTSLHAVVHRRDARAALWWATWVWIVPFGGPLLYYFFGINRIERKAARLRRPVQLPGTAGSASGRASSDLGPLSREHPNLQGLEKLVEGVVHAPLLGGNRVTPHLNVNDASADMLRAIDSAKSSIALSTYIFHNDPVGKEFISALSRAAQRGVEVRVLIDDVGSGFAWTSVFQELHQNKVPVAYFLPSLMPWRMAYLNMRNHRKILTVDGRVGFTGGMNIGHPKAVQDIHFRIEGPVVAQIQDVFRIDWYFTTGEILGGEKWYPVPEDLGPVLARGIPDGPDEDFEKTRMTMLAAITHARTSVRIATPYLIPDGALISALNVAAMSGVAVDICLPQKNDMKIVQWATTAMLWQVLERGCRVWMVPPPFDHSKLMVVDSVWTLLGSSNWDPRSLRLNFEFNVECYDQALGNQMDRSLREKMARSRKLTLFDVDSRPFPIKVRDGLARLMNPLL